MYKFTSVIVLPGKESAPLAFLFGHILSTLAATQYTRSFGLARSKIIISILRLPRSAEVQGLLYVILKTHSFESLRKKQPENWLEGQEVGLGWSAGRAQLRPWPWEEDGGTALSGLSWWEMGGYELSTLSHLDLTENGCLGSKGAWWCWWGDLSLGPGIT